MADTKRFSQGWTVADVIDTRDYELVGDRWKPIPGSGDPEPCACCGKALVIHVHVQKDKERAILGQACAGKASSRLTAGIKSVGIRRPDPLVDDLIAVGLKLDKARTVAHNARVFTETGHPLWTALYGGISRPTMELCAIMACQWASFSGLFRRRRSHGPRKCILLTGWYLTEVTS